LQWNIDDVPLFVAVVRENGFSAAARALHVPKSTISTAVSRLETALGVRLLDRNSRNVRMTGDGEVFYRQSLMIMEQVREADAMISGLRAEPAGRLSVALPPAFTQEIVAPHLAAFQKTYPDIDLDILVTTHTIDVLNDQLDIAVVVGPLEDSDMISRTLVSGRLIWVSSRAYLDENEIGDTLESLQPHVTICEKRYGIARMPVHAGAQARVIDLSRGITHVNSPLVVRQAVQNGAGVSLLPHHYCIDQLADGGLVQVCKHIAFDLEASKLTVVYPSRRLMSPRTRAFLDFLNRICARLGPRVAADVAGDTGQGPDRSRDHDLMP